MHFRELHKQNIFLTEEQEKSILSAAECTTYQWFHLKWHFVHKTKKKVFKI